MSHPPAALRRLILLIATALLSAPVLAVAGAAAPADACPAADPYTRTCASAVNHKVSGTDGTLAVQTRPQVDNVWTATTTQATSLNPSAYPWPTQDAWVADGHGYYEGECTSFAAWAVRSDGLHHTQSPDWLGNAGTWHAPLDATPHAGDVAQWDGGHNGAGPAGHVAYVAAVYSNGTVKIQEYNWGNFHRLNIRIIPASAPSRYLRF